MNKRALGKRYEEKACRYLESKGMKMVEKNFRCRQGEIDLIGLHEGYLVFVEVKYRAENAGHAAEAVTEAKQRKICRTADYYRYRHRIGEDRAMRYDVVAMQGTENNLRIVWYKNAFFHRSR